MSDSVEQGRLVLSEEAQIRRWRRAQFLALGFSLREAQAMTRAPVDLGQMRTLIASSSRQRYARGRGAVRREQREELARGPIPGLAGGLNRPAQ